MAFGTPYELRESKSDKVLRETYDFLTIYLIPLTMSFVLLRLLKEFYLVCTGLQDLPLSHLGTSADSLAFHGY